MACGEEDWETEFRSNARRARSFYAVWSRLANNSECDALDSVECVRVYAEWVDAGRPATIAAFIREAANRPSDSPLWLV